MFLFQSKAGKMTNEEEIERMLESGNPQIFTEGVRIIRASSKIH